MKKVLITGGAGGIGCEIVKKFVNEGYFVYLIDKDKMNSITLVNEVGINKCKYIELDVTDVEAIKKIKKTFDEKFILDHIITLAGRALENEWINFEEQDLDEIHNSVNVNLLGHINIIHEFYQYLKQSSENASVVMISSINAISNYGLPGYSASKSGLYGFMNAVVNEFGKDGIRINTISPGTVVTPATKKEPKDFEKLLQGTALRKFATPKDIANMVYELCNTFTTVTGQNIIVDAGQSKMHSF